MNELVLHKDSHADTSRAIARLDDARRALAEAETAPQVKKVRDVVKAIRDLMKEQRRSLAEQNEAAELRLCCERKLGDILSKTVDQKRGRFDCRDVSRKMPEGISHAKSSRWQKLADPDISDALFREILFKAKENGIEITTNYVMREIKWLTLYRDRTVGEVAPPNGTYGTIVVDPPWPLKRTNGFPLDYETEKLDKIRAIKIPAAENCQLFLWTTQTFLPISYEILKGWGFEYVYTFVWKKNGGMQIIGQAQSNCEFVLYGRKGSPTFTTTKGFKTCFYAPRGKHSEKPEEFYDMVRRVTNERRLDMFGRRRIEGFESWGKEAPSSKTTPEMEN